MVVGYLYLGMMFCSRCLPVPEEEASPLYEEEATDGWRRCEWCGEML